MEKTNYNEDLRKTVEINLTEEEKKRRTEMYQSFWKDLVKYVSKKEFE